MEEDSQEEVQETKEQRFIYSAKGEPFKTETAARVAQAQKHLDPDVFVIVRVESEEEPGKYIGFALENREYGVPDKYRGYWRVVFSDRAHPNDTPDVSIPVNGETLLFQRGVETIAPGRFLEAADGASYPHFVQRPNEPRKELGSIKTFPYERKGKATKKECLDLRAAGNKKSEEQVKKFGFDYDQEVS